MSDTTNPQTHALTTSDTGTTDPCAHPRPTLTRTSWRSLDGLWSFARGDDPDGSRPDFGSAGASIEVPFAPESPRSGVGTISDERVCWYARELELPDEWRGKRVWLHFNAVDWAATRWCERPRRLDGHLG